MFELFTEGVTLLNTISLLAFFTTVGLFFCGVPICRQILKRKGTKEISGAPFMMGVVGGSCWWTYGFLKHDQTLLYVTSTQVVLYSLYLIFYWFMTFNKLKISLKCGAVVSICVSLYLLVHFFGMKVHHPLGAVCLCLNVADFAAPLAGLKYVIRKRSTQTLPLPLCIANFMVSTEWFIYGLLVRDPYLILPNGIGSILASGQLIIFLVLPRKTGLQSPLKKMINILLCNPNAKVAAVEPDAVKVIPRKQMMDEMRIAKHTWPERVIANVTEEIGNVLQKCSIKDQFGYNNVLVNEESDSVSCATASTLEKLDSNQSTISSLSEENSVKLDNGKGGRSNTSNKSDGKQHDLSVFASQLIAKLEPTKSGLKPSRSVEKLSCLKRSISVPNVKINF